MLDRRSDREIIREAQEASATRFGQLASATRDMLDALRAYTHLVEFLIVISIIAIVAAFLWPNYLQARHAAYVTTCLMKLNQLGLAMDMYRMDYGDYPPVGKWYAALGKSMSAAEKKAQPFKCQLDHSADPTSYCYLNRSLLRGGQRQWPITDTPMLVDELHHPFKTTILWYDGHQTAVDKLEWVHMRRDKYQIRRDLIHPEWFCFIPTELLEAEEASQPEE